MSKWDPLIAAHACVLLEHLYDVYKADGCTLEVTASEVASTATSIFLDAIPNLMPPQQQAAVTDDTPASALMTESPINTNTKSSGMRVEGRVTCPPKSTPTKHRYVAVTRYDEERQRTMKDDKERQVLEP